MATRESPLAIKQAELVKAMLLKLHPHLTVDLLGLTTQADSMLDMPLLEIGGKGLFVKELEQALLEGRADVAVHSMKDVPMELAAELHLPVMLKREEVRDVFISNHYHSFGELPSNAVVGTSSLRRQTQLHALRADIAFQPLRGNINTRLKRLDQGDYAAIVLAAAGLKRMDWQARIRAYFSIEQLLPAAGQGALGIECRKDDTHTLELIAPLNDETTYTCVQAERAVCQALGGNCQVPVAAYAEQHHQKLTVRGLVANEKGRILRATREGHPQEGENMGKRVAEELLQQGAMTLLKAFLT